MQKFFLIFIYFLSVNSLSFSQVNIIGEPNITNFPDVDLIIQNRDPKILDKNSFVIYEFENDVKIESDSFQIKRVESIDSTKKNKSVIFLIETLKHYARIEQNHTFYKAISEVLPNIVNPGDNFKIVTFSLKNGKENILKDVNKEFTDNYSKLISDLNAHETPTNSFTNKQASNIYGAVIEAVEQLDALDSNFPKSIFLFSEERHNKEIINVRESAINIAKNKGVVINSIKYNRHLYETHSDPTLAINTYGLNKILTKSSGNLDAVNIKKKQEIINFVESTMDNVIERSFGVRYLVTLNLKNKLNDGKKYFIELKVDDTNTTQKISYVAPGNWIISQFQINLYSSLIVSVFIILILFFIIYYAITKIKSKSKEKSILLNSQNEKIVQQEKDLTSQKEELLDLKNKVHESKKLVIAQEQKEKEIESIEKMLVRGSFPFLKISDSNGTRNVEVNKPLFRVGRDPSSDLILNSKNISRNHFIIVFENFIYKIKDNNSTNGILLNGKMIEESEINNADIIEIAETSLTFYK